MEPEDVKTEEGTGLGGEETPETVPDPVTGEPIPAVVEVKI